MAVFFDCQFCVKSCFGLLHLPEGLNRNKKLENAEQRAFPVADRPISAAADDGDACIGV